MRGPPSSNELVKVALGELAGPFFSRLHAEERGVTGGTEGNTLANRGFLFQCTRVAMERGSTKVFHTLRQGWKQPPSATTRHGKPHLATLKAGLWDEPPQLARALATGFWSAQRLDTSKGSELACFQTAPFYPPCWGFFMEKKNSRTTVQKRSASGFTLFTLQSCWRTHRQIDWILVQPQKQNRRYAVTHHSLFEAVPSHAHAHAHLCRVVVGLTARRAIQRVHVLARHFSVRVPKHPAPPPPPVYTP